MGMALGDKIGVSEVKLFFCNLLYRNSFWRLKNAQAIQYKAQVLMPGFKDPDNVKLSAGENLEGLAGRLSLEGYEIVSSNNVPKTSFVT